MYTTHTQTHTDIKSVADIKKVTEALWFLATVRGQQPLQVNLLIYR